MGKGLHFFLRSPPFLRASFSHAFVHPPSLRRGEKGQRVKATAAAAAATAAATAAAAAAAEAAAAMACSWLDKRAAGRNVR